MFGFIKKFLKREERWEIYINPPYFNVGKFSIRKISNGDITFYIGSYSSIEEAESEIVKLQEIDSHSIEIAKTITFR